MPFLIVRNDIIKMQVDAIVNAANSSLLGGGGVDGCIHRAAGPGLLAECRTLGGCPTGEARITGGYDLPARYVIHTVGPIWQGGNMGEPQALRACYLNSLRLAAEHGCETVAFPLISAGVYGYPADKAVEIARITIGDFLIDHDLTVYLVLFSKKVFSVSRALFDDVAAYVDDRYVDETARFDPRRAVQRLSREAPRRSSYRTEWEGSFVAQAMSVPQPDFSAELDFENILLDESFSQRLVRLIGEKGLTNAQCYRRANIQKQLFSKIISNPHYKPSKPTVLAFAVALELDLPATRSLLESAGFALSHSQKFDIIVEYFIQKKRYDILEINETLYSFDQPLLGNVG